MTSVKHMTFDLEGGGKPREVFGSNANVMSSRKTGEMNVFL